jgi:zinc transporter 1
MGWSKSTRIIVMLVIDIMFFALELGVGITVGSLALMADAFHMASVRGARGTATRLTDYS